MALKICEKGHHYDDAIYGSCPMCAVSVNEATQFNPPVKVKRITISRKRVEEEDEKTIAYHSEFTGNNYVTGWLICSEGSEKGRDYRLHYGFNRIGTSGMMDVCINGDPEIVERYHCAVVYDSKSNGFFVTPGKGTITYVNGELLRKSRPLERGDGIEIGKTRLEFIPYCGGDKKWD